MWDYTLTEKTIKNVVVGTGAAGYNAAIRLRQFGEADTVIVTEGIRSGTSRNTGSDKQTYYKLSLAGEDKDCTKDLAGDLFAGQCVDGDIALCEAALSVRSFFHLTEAGVPFPCNEYGEYMGYKTDHDQGRRATSAGPYTSKMMTEALQTKAEMMGIPVLDRYQVIKILTADQEVQGLLCLDGNDPERLHYTVIWCEHVVFAAGGPAAMYRDSVYPGSQHGSSGIAFEAGVKGKNLTEWQFGISSVKPRWNVSGTYMQVLPRFISTDENGQDEQEFLYDFYEKEEELLSNVFLKGYQWPFDTNKIFGGSSVIDLLVYQESICKGRRVFLDFRSNPGGRAAIDFDGLSREACGYLKSAGACFGTPLDRLLHMNEPAVSFYREHGVDLARDLLEIRICAQHNNGGLAADHNWETDIKGFFTVGEVCGSHGVTRPGGSALNAGQAGSLRAAECIAYRKKEQRMDEQESLRNRAGCRGQIESCIQMLMEAKGNAAVSEVWQKAASRMSRQGGMIRTADGVREALAEVTEELRAYRCLTGISGVNQAGMFYRLYDMLLSQRVYLHAMIDYMEHGGGSRGSALYYTANGEKPDEKLSDLFRCELDRGQKGALIQEVQLFGEECRCTWRAVRPVPEPDYFFETQWKEYRKRYLKEG